MLPRFRHLLIPMDFTRKNLAALDVAFELASQNRARTTLLHVVERIPAGEPGEEDPELSAFYERLQARATTDLESMSQRFAQAGLEVEYKVWVGQRVPEIVRFVADRAALGHAYAVAGKRSEAVRVLNELRELAKQGKYVSSYELAVVHIGLREKEEAFMELEKAYRQRDGQLPNLKVDHRFGPLRPDPRFADLLRRIGLADKAAARDQPILTDVPAHEQRDDDEEQRRHQPQHEDVLRHVEIDAEDGWQVDQRVVKPAVGDVADDEIADVHALGGVSGSGRFWRMILRSQRQTPDALSAPPTAPRQTAGAASRPRSHRARRSMP